LKCFEVDYHVLLTALYGREVADCSRVAALLPAVNNLVMQHDAAMQHDTAMQHDAAMHNVLLR
jgi:hypothetical protein